MQHTRLTMILAAMNVFAPSIFGNEYDGWSEAKNLTIAVMVDEMATVAPDKMGEVVREFLLNIKNNPTNAQLIDDITEETHGNLEAVRIYTKLAILALAIAG